MLVIADELPLSKFTYGEPGSLTYQMKLLIFKILFACNLEISEHESQHAKAYRWTYIRAMDDGFDIVDNVK